MLSITSEYDSLTTSQTRCVWADDEPSMAKIDLDIVEQELPWVDSLSDFRDQIRRFQNSSGDARIGERQRLVDTFSPTIGSGNEFAENVDEILEAFVCASYAGRLHDAVDVLSSLGLPMFRHGLVCLCAGKARHWSDDHFYIVARSMAEIAGELDDKVQMMWLTYLLRFEHVAIQEAATEALADQGSDAAIATLRRIANEADSALIRDLATEALEGRADA